MRSVRKLALGGLVLVLLEVILLVALARLQYSTAWLVRTSDEDVSAAPNGLFSIGSVEWPVSAYAASPALDAFRRSFQSSCGPTKDDAIAAALCVSNRMASTFPHGKPESEFVAPSFDPIVELTRHRSGDAGHCVTRSAILATELLSVGVPARVVQLVPLDGSDGHNLVEVWEAGTGWALVDPTYGGLVGEESEPWSALELASASSVRFQPVGRAPAPLDELERPEVEAIIDGLLPAAVIYPEPWLYLRMGEKTAPWPFRGRYIHAGPGTFLLGPAHHLLVAGLVVVIPLCASIWFMVVVRVARHLTQARTLRPASSVSES